MSQPKNQNAQKQLAQKTLKEKSSKLMTDDSIISFISCNRCKKDIEPIKAKLFLMVL